MIFNLQIMRALAAIGVVIYHIDYRIVADVHTDFLGVATFFVLSGFIMCYITRDEAKSFLLDRIIRIVPLYWFFTLVRVTILGGWSDSDAIVRSLLFLPSDQPPLVAVGWTLNFEIYFYVVFAVALWISRQFAPVIAGGTILAVLAINTVFPDLFLTRYYSHSYICFFLGGIALFYLWQAVPLRLLPKWPTAIIGITVLIFAYAIQAGLQEPGRWTLSLPVIIVGSALLMERAGADFNIRPLVFLGAASYSIYLSHTLAMGAIRRIAPDVLDLARTQFAWFVGMLSFCIVVGVLIHLAIEKPMLSFLRAQVRSRRALARSTAYPRISA